MHTFKFLNKAVALFKKKFDKDSVYACCIKYDRDLYFVVYHDITNFVAVCGSEFNGTALDRETPNALELSALKHVAGLTKQQAADMEIIISILNEDSYTVHDTKHPSHQFHWGEQLEDVFQWDDKLTSLCHVVNSKPFKIDSFRPQLDQVFTSDGKVAVTNGHFLVQSEFESEVSLLSYVASLISYGVKSQKIEPVFINNIKSETLTQVHLIGEGRPVIISSSAFLHEGPSVSALSDNFTPSSYSRVDVDSLLTGLAFFGKSFGADDILSCCVEEEAAYLKMPHARKSLGKVSSVGFSEDPSRTVNWRADYIKVLIELDVEEFLVTDDTGPSVFIGKSLDSLIMPKRGS